MGCEVTNGREEIREQWHGARWEPPRGRRWREEDARAGLSAARSSGKPLSRFAREHGIEVSRFYWWAKELKRSLRNRQHFFLFVWSRSELRLCAPEDGDRQEVRLGPRRSMSW